MEEKFLSDPNLESDSYKPALYYHDIIFYSA